MAITSSAEAVEPPAEIRQLMYDSLKAKGDLVFMIDGLTGEKLTFRELLQKSSSVAVYLNKSGIGDGSKVAFLSEVSVETQIILVGVWLSGAAACPMNPTSKPEEIRQLLDICKAELIFCQGTYLTLLEAAISDGSKPVVVTDAGGEKYTNIEKILLEDPSEFRMGSYDPEESIMHVLFTSGTTGTPKGVMCNSRATKVIVFRLNFKPGYFLCTSPLYWMSYIAFVTCSLIHGITLVLPRTKYIPGTNEVDLTHILDCVQKYKPVYWFTGPSTLLDLTRNPSSSSYDTSSLQRVTVGGSHIIPFQMRQICDILFNGRNILVNGYGATEVGVVTFWPPKETVDYESPVAASLGKLVSGFTLKVEDVDTGKELGAGEIGEFVVKSTALMKGYINEDLPERYNTDDWYRMGDLGYYDDEGYIYFVSRLKEIIKYRGLQISPAELEKVVLEHPLVDEVCVVGRPHSIDGERPAAFVVRKNDKLTEDQLQQFLDDRVADSKKVRGGIFFVDSIPKSAIGKVLRRKLVEFFQGKGDE